jgi:Flp pilus assembly protein CpaB
MADDRMALFETLREATGDGDVDVLREGVRILAQAIMGAEVRSGARVPVTITSEASPSQCRAAAAARSFVPSSIRWRSAPDPGRE